MERGVRIGRLLGIEIRLGWSWIFMFFLVTSSLSGLFTRWHPTWPSGLTYGVALAAGLLFFASVLAHELAHSLVARRHGIRVDGITLWMLGGVARLDGGARSPRAEFLIAAAGPGTSLLLAGVFGVGAAAISVLGGPGLLGSALGWLAVINAILAVFNLIPAAPLDGGRILSSILWAVRGDRNRAMATAAQVGIVFGWLLVGVGAASWLVGLGFGGLWTALIGWFVISAARAEREFARSRLAYGDLRVRDVMTADPPRARGWLTVEEFLRDDAPRLHEVVVPVDRFDGGIAGLANVDQLRSVPPNEASHRRVLDHTVQLPSLRRAQPDDRLSDVAALPARGPTQSILVFDGDRFVGIVTPADLERARAAASTSAPGV
jgi:Zn-dependent protease